MLNLMLLKVTTKI